MTITRENYETFCTEPPLDTLEIAALARARGAARNSRALREFFEANQDWLAAVKEERAVGLRGRSDDWADVVAYADACRRRQRCEIAVYEQWRIFNMRPTP